MSSDIARTNTPLAKPGTDLVEIARESKTIQELGQTLIASGLLPDAIKKPEAAMAIILKGRECGMDIMYALSHIAIISGKPTMSAEAMLALVQRSGHRIRIKESTAERCTVEGVRANDQDYPTEITWTMDDAKAAQLAGKGPWKTYPRAMLRARAISELCRAMFADVLSGVSYVPEELGVAVDGEGEIVGSTDNTNDTDDGSDDVEEAEIVAEGSDGEADLDAYLDRISEAHDRLPDHSRAPIGTVLEYVGDDMRKARTVLARLNRDYEAAVERGEIIGSSEATSGERAS